MYHSTVELLPKSAYIDAKPTTPGFLKTVLNVNPAKDVKQGFR